MRNWMLIYRLLCLYLYCILHFITDGHLKRNRGSSKFYTEVSAITSTLLGKSCCVAGRIGYRFDDMKHTCKLDRAIWYVSLASQHNAHTGLFEVVTAMKASRQLQASDAIISKCYWDYGSTTTYVNASSNTSMVNIYFEAYSYLLYHEHRLINVSVCFTFHRQNRFAAC